MIIYTVHCGTNVGICFVFPTKSLDFVPDRFPNGISAAVGGVQAEREGVIKRSECQFDKKYKVC